MLACHDSAAPPRVPSSASGTVPTRELGKTGVRVSMIGLGGSHIGKKLSEAESVQLIPLAARGSAVSSLVGHLLGFSPVDPLEQGLYFERFASEARRRPPDIDLDVASRGREQLVTWLLEHHCAGGALRLSALHGFGVRSALREALKAFGSSPRQIEECLRSLPPRELEAPLGALRWPDGVRAAQPLLERLIGKPRQLALHPGGVVLGAPEQLELIPLEARSSGLLVSQYDAPSISALGLCKVDLLGNRCLDEMADTLRARAPAEPWSRGDGRDIPMADAATLSRVDAAQTIGCHQLESPAMRAVLASLPIRGLRDICHALAIVRPGPASGSAKEAFLARARGEAPPARVPSELVSRLAATHGMLLYEEDITCVLSTLAGVSLAAAEALRVRLVERSDDSAWLARVGQRFQSRALERGFELADVQALWADVLRLGRYSFSRAHSCSQALLAYRATFLSCHAPVEFGCASLNHHGGSYPRRVIASDLARRGIELRLPSVLRGLAGCEPEPVRAIRIGLGLVKGLRSGTRQLLRAWQQARSEPPSLEDLLARVAFQRRELEALLWSGALDEIAGLRPADYPWLHRALWGALARGEPSLLGAVLAEARLRIPAQSPQLLARYSGLCRLQGELRYLEMHVSDHPMRLLRGEADQLSCVVSESLGRHVDQVVSFGGIVAATRNVGLAEGEAMQFITLEDEHGVVEARLSPAAWRSFHPRLATPGPYLLRGRVRRHQGALFLQILELAPFHERGTHLPVSAWAAATGLD
ncbi:MAG TPA: hypothetical protein VFS67_20425 [Polyangiaceae bacterium]|nr:hypothetical protein [Polyangiaceae bacterium]